jgi:hypothetical protein
LIADQYLDDAGLDAFLAQARKLADQWLALTGPPLWRHCRRQPMSAPG